jgi:hypothetical protein
VAFFVSEPGNPEDRPSAGRSSASYTTRLDANSAGARTGRSYLDVLHRLGAFEAGRGDLERFLARSDRAEAASRPLPGPA